MVYGVTNNQYLIKILFNQVFEDASNVKLYLMGGTIPTSEEAEMIDSDTRASDVLGSLNINITDGNVEGPIPFTPVKDGTVTWVILENANPSLVNGKKLSIVSDEVGLGDSDSFFMLNNLACTTGVENSLLDCYFKIV